MTRIHPTSGGALHTSGCGWLLRGSARAPPLVPFEARCHGPACQCALSPGYQTLQATVGFATSYAIGEATVATAVVTTFLVRLARYVYGHGRSFSSRGCRSAASPRAHTGNRHQHGRGEDVVGATNRLLPETFQWCSIAGVAPLSRDVRAPTAPSSISPSWVATTAERAVIAITRNERAEPEPRSRCRVWHPVESVHHHADPWQRAMDSTSDTRNERVEPER